MPPRRPNDDAPAPGVPRGRRARRVGLAALLALAAATAASPAAAQDDARAETVEGLVRVVGAQAGIVLYCRARYTIDDAVSVGLARTARRALDQAFGARKAQAAIDAEGRRVSGEIDRIGAERWCADQREILNADGVRVFVD